MYFQVPCKATDKQGNEPVKSLSDFFIIRFSPRSFFMRFSILVLLGLALVSASVVYAVDSDRAPRPTPLTRPEMKQYLEDMKERKLRIPLPELTDADKEKLGERAFSYESRLRYHYSPSNEGQGAGRTGGAGGGGFGRESDSDMTLDYAFKTQLFWIVSRTNNCQY
jgi:hypothetical protein